ELLLGRLGSVARQGDHARAVAGAEPFAKKAEKVTADGFPMVFQLAVVYALAATAVSQDAQLPAADRDSLAGQHADRGLDLLGRAYAAAPFLNPRDLELLKTDPDLATVRSRPGYEKLVSEAAARVRGAAK